MARPQRGGEQSCGRVGEQHRRKEHAGQDLRHRSALGGALDGPGLVRVLAKSQYGVGGEQVVELFAYFDRAQNSVIDVLEIKHGLPFRMIVTEVPA